MSTKSEVKERPILFSGEMVRAIIDGRKTQTRRVVKPQPSCFWHGDESLRDPNTGVSTGLPYDRDNDRVIRCPYGQPGDRLWVRETWHIVADHDGEGCISFQADNAAFKVLADNGGEGDIVERTDTTTKAQQCDKWRPSIHMPRWASRLALEITSVRVERLQDISEADAAAEGVGRVELSPSVEMGEYRGLKMMSHPQTSTHVHAFRVLWDDLNTKHGHSWESNPWVWVVEFIVCKEQRRGLGR